MQTRLRVDGIYDSRTLKFLQGKGVRHFGFNFSPKSFNFIQEYVFIEKLIPMIGINDRVDLSFVRSDDPMIEKVLYDLRKAGFKTENVTIICDEWVKPQSEKQHHYYYLNFSTQTKPEELSSVYFRGIIFKFDFFQELHQKNLISTFTNNFFTRFGPLIDQKEMILSIGWRDNVYPGLMDTFDFDKVSFSIDSDIETCYRNVDLNKLGREMNFLAPENNF